MILYLIIYIHIYILYKFILYAYNIDKINVHNRPRKNPKKLTSFVKLWDKKVSLGTSPNTANTIVLMVCLCAFSLPTGHQFSKINQKIFVDLRFCRIYTFVYFMVPGKI